jgi:DNA-binding MurR/RpiR family transcriptional regulator
MDKADNQSVPASKNTSSTEPAALVRTEAAALEALAERLEGAMAADFERAVEMILRCGEERGRVVVTGMGKSGIIAQKIAATLSSTGSPALFLHPAEAVHGDLGVLMPGDVVVALSASGETEEILRLLATLKRKGDGLVSFSCNLNSTLAERCGSGLLRGARSLRPEPGAHRLHHHHAGPGRCPRHRGQPAQGLPRRGFR